MLVHNDKGSTGRSVESPQLTVAAIMGSYAALQSAEPSTLLALGPEARRLTVAMLRALILTDPVLNDPHTTSTLPKNPYTNPSQNVDA